MCFYSRFSYGDIFILVRVSFKCVCSGVEVTSVHDLYGDDAGGLKSRIILVACKKLY